MKDINVPPVREPQPFVISHEDYVPIEDFFPDGSRAVLAIVRTVDAIYGPPTYDGLLNFRRIVGFIGVRNDQGLGPDYAKMLRTLGERDARYKGRGFIITHIENGILWGKKFGLNPETNEMRLKKIASDVIPKQILVDRMLILRVPNPV